MVVPEKASCWVCRRTVKDVIKILNSVAIDTEDGKLKPWICLDHIIPILKNSIAFDTDPIIQEKKIYVCPICREILFQLGYRDLFGFKDEDGNIKNN